MTLLDLSEAERLFYGADELSAVYRDGERLWPFGPDLLYAGGVAGAAFVPDAGAVFADTGGTTPTGVLGSIARINDVSGSANHALQATAGQRPILGRAPSSIRNLLLSTEDLTAAAWTADEGTTLAIVDSKWTRLTATADGSTDKRSRAWSVSAVPMEPSAPLVLSARFRLGGGQTTIALGAWQPTTKYGWAAYNTATATWSTHVVSTAGTFAGLAAVDEGDGVWWIAVLYTPHASQQGFTVRVVVHGGNGAAADLRFTPAQSGYMDVTDVQCERGSAPSNYQRVGVSSADITEDGVPSHPLVRFDLVDDRLAVPVPAAIAGDLVIAGRNGTWVQDVALAPGTYTIGPLGVPEEPHILTALGAIVGIALFDKTLADVERMRLMRYFGRRGAKGIFSLGPELLTNPSFDTAGGAGWTVSGPGVNWSTPGEVSVADVAGVDSYIAQEIPGVELAAVYCVEFNLLAKIGAGSLTFRFGRAVNLETYGSLSITAFGLGVHRAYFTAGSLAVHLTLVATAANQGGTLGSISCRRLIPGDLP